MALSDSFDYTSTVTAAQIIALALRRLGVYDPDETINSTEEANALQVLNLIVKEWANQGADIWLRDTMNLVLNTRTSTRGTTKLWYTTNSDYLLFGFSACSTLTADLAIGGTSITVDDASNFNSLNLIFIKLEDNSIHATTINGAPVGSTITLTAGPTVAANSGAVVYSCLPTSRFLGTILQVLSASRYEPTDALKENFQESSLLSKNTPIEVIGSDEYHSLSQRDQIGDPLYVYHVRKPTLSEFHIWPRVSSPTVDALELVVRYPVMDLDSTADNLYITPDAFNALAWDLAAQLASEYGLSEQEQKRLWNVAEAKKTDVFDFNVENASVILTKDH